MKTKLTVQEFNDRQVRFCEYWLKNYTRMWHDLTHKRFNDPTLMVMINYEMVTRQRKNVLDRLVGRLYKMRREAALREIAAWVKTSEKGVHAPIVMFNLEQDTNFLQEGLDAGDCN